MKKRILGLSLVFAPLFVLAQPNPGSGPFPTPARTNFALLNVNHLTATNITGNGSGLVGLDTNASVQAAIQAFTLAYTTNIITYPDPTTLYASGAGGGLANGVYRRINQGTNFDNVGLNGKKTFAYTNANCIIFYGDQDAYANFTQSYLLYPLTNVETLNETTLAYANVDGSGQAGRKGDPSGRGYANNFNGIVVPIGAWTDVVTLGWVNGEGNLPGLWPAPGPTITYGTNFVTNIVASFYTTNVFAQNKTIYVDATNGSDQFGSMPLGLPYKTLHVAQRIAPSGSTYYIAQGWYDLTDSGFYPTNATIHASTNAVFVNTDPLFAPMMFPIDSMTWDGGIFFWTNTTMYLSITNILAPLQMVTMLSGPSVSFSNVVFNSGYATLQGNAPDGIQVSILNSTITAYSYAIEQQQSVSGTMIVSGNTINMVGNGNHTLGIQANNGSVYAISNTFKIWPSITNNPGNLNEVLFSAAGGKLYSQGNTIDTSALGGVTNLFWLFHSTSTGTNYAVNIPAGTANMVVTNWHVAGTQPFLTAPYPPVITFPPLANYWPNEVWSLASVTNGMNVGDFKQANSNGVPVLVWMRAGNYVAISNLVNEAAP